MATNASERAIVLSRDRTLIEVPSQTIKGIEATCLLNPRININSYVMIKASLTAQRAAKLNNTAGAEDEKNRTYDLSGNFAGQNYRVNITGTSASGLCKVLWVRHYSEPRGTGYYTTVHCYAPQAGAVISQAGIEALPWVAASTTPLSFGSGNRITRQPAGVTLAAYERGKATRRERSEAFPLRQVLHHGGGATGLRQVFRHRGNFRLPGWSRCPRLHVFNYRGYRCLRLFLHRLIFGGQVLYILLDAREEVAHTRNG